jgi:molybdopterin synthase catalytic subunit
LINWIPACAGMTGSQSGLTVEVAGFRGREEIADNDRLLEAFSAASGNRVGISIQQEDFDLGAELAGLRQRSGKAGALVSFVGLVRDFSGGAEVSSIHLEHYPGMCEKALEEIVAAATARWQLLGVRVIHRVGTLQPNEQIVLVATAAEHRGNAFAGCEFIIDYLKTAAPFWKKENSTRGGEWLGTSESDLRRMEKWRK